MLKLVILDDEKMERSYMKKYIAWDEMGIEVAGEASNGIDGLQICREIKPDIILTDIKMPEMDGLEFSRQVKDILPDVKIIFISGYGDFDYAKSAVDLNAFGYILKPFRVENIYEVIKKVTSKCDEEQRKDREREQLRRILEENKAILKDNLIRELISNTEINDNIWERIGYLGLNITQDQHCVLMIEIDEYEEIAKDFDIEEKHVFTISFLDCIKNILEQKNYGEAIKVSEKHFIALLNLTNETDEENNIQKAYSIAEAIHNQIVREIKISVTIGISSISDNLSNLPYMKEEALDAVKYKLFDMKGQLICINDVKLHNDKFEIDLKKLDTQLVEYLKVGNRERINSLVDEVLDNIMPVKEGTNGYIQNICISMVCSAMRFLNEIHCSPDDIFGNWALVWNKLAKFETIADVKQWLRNIFAAIMDTVNSKKKSKNRMIVDRIIELIHENYANDLTTKELSREIYLSPNYIGVIFKEEMEIGILEYITKIRMEKAEEMLKDPNLKIYEIAQRVGYNNTPYFSTLFRDYAGLTPSEYRSKL